jgi:hypothetical protein
VISREQKKEIIKQFCDFIGTGPDTVRSVQALDSQKKLPSHYINTNDLDEMMDFVIKWEDKYQLYITHNQIKTDSKGWIKGYRPDFCDIHAKLLGIVVCQIIGLQPFISIKKK